MQVFVLVEKNAPGKGRGQPLGDQVFPETRGTKLETRNPKPETRNPKPRPEK